MTSLSQLQVRYKYSMAQLYLTENYSPDTGVGLNIFCKVSFQISYSLRSEHYVWLSSPKGEGKVKVSARHATKPDTRRCKVESAKVKTIFLQ